MTRASNEKASQSPLQKDTAPPTQPGVCWFRSETMPCEVPVAVCLKDGKLSAWWLNLDDPATNLKGVWRGPIPPFAGPDSS